MWSLLGRQTLLFLSLQFEELAKTRAPSPRPVCSNAQTNNECLAKSKQEMGVSCRGESGQLNAPDDAFVATANKRTFAFER